MLSQEAQLLTRFFEAARLHDTVVMARYADVTFNPRVEGVVDTFEIEDVAAIDDQSKRVTVQAQLRTPGGQMAERDLIVTMRRGDDGWRITEIR